MGATGINEDKAGMTSAAEKLVYTKYGTICGRIENGCEVYRGIPYAAPPVGNLRYRKPQPPKAWSGIYDAACFRSKSMQVTRGGFYKKEFYSNPEFEVSVSEDCLYLNIWKPETSEGSSLPVAVYVHGGAFMGGAGSNLPFVCTELAKKGVLVVTINYRLGGFGFLCHPYLAEAGENMAGGNYGLWDQLTALCWVKENIESFGGDPENVTVFGQSAGAMSLQLLALTSQAEGLFQKMILQSGGGYQNPLAEYKSVQEASEIAEDVLEQLGLNRYTFASEEERKACAGKLLRESSSEEMMSALNQAIENSFKAGKGFPFAPVVDGELLRDNCNRLMEKGKFLHVPCILGSNKNDITTENQDHVEMRTNQMHQANLNFARLVDQMTKENAYVYFFEHPLPGDEAGAFHSAELWYVFGSLDYCWRPFTEEDYRLADEMMIYWSNFMKNGQPGTGAEDWPVCTQERPYVKRFQ